PTGSGCAPTGSGRAPTGSGGAPTGSGRAPTGAHTSISTVFVGPERKAKIVVGLEVDPATVQVGGVVPPTGSEGDPGAVHPAASRRRRGIRMSTTKTTHPNQATVRRGVFRDKRPADALESLSNTCTAGAACTEVQNDPVASKALGVLQAAVTTSQG